MKKITLIALSILFIYSCASKQNINNYLNSFSEQQLNDIYFLPSITDVSEGFYSSYYRKPENIEELKKFAVFMDKDKTGRFYYTDIFLNYTIPKIKKNNLSIKIDQTPCGFQIFADSVLVEENRMSPCCDSIHLFRDTMDYIISQKSRMEKIRYFNKKENLILNKSSLDRDILKQKREIENRFHKSIFSENTQFITLSYKLGERYTPICNVDDSIDFNSEYFKALENLLYSFLLKNKVNRIIFTTILPD